LWARTHRTHRLRADSRQGQLQQDRLHVRWWARALRWGIEPTRGRVGFSAVGRCQLRRLHHRQAMKRRLALIGRCSPMCCDATGPSHGSLCSIGAGRRRAGCVWPQAEPGEFFTVRGRRHRTDRYDDVFGYTAFRRFEVPPSQRARHCLRQRGFLWDALQGESSERRQLDTILRTIRAMHEPVLALPVHAF
jgi:hypothetical protein